VKLTLLEVTGPEPDPGLRTVIASDPAAATAESGRTADRVVLPRNEVAMAVPLTCIEAPYTKACPTICKETAVAPATTLLGLSEVIVATGTGWTVNMKGVDTAAFGAGFEIVTGNVPVAVSNEAGRVACI
jgi:hypothetical protein